MDDTQYHGVVRSFNPVKGWGFIASDGAKQRYGSDTFLLKSELKGYGAYPGDTCTFNVKEGPKGTQATNVQVTCADPTQQAFFGEVRTWNAEKGYGFLSSEAANLVYGKDAFVLKSEFSYGPPAVGATCMYKVKVSDRGPVASEVQVLGGAQPGGDQWGGAAAAWGANAGQVPAAWVPQGVAAGWGAAKGCGKGGFGGPAAVGGYGPCSGKGMVGPGPQYCGGGKGGPYGGGQFCGGGAQYCGGGGGAQWGEGPRMPSERDVFYGSVKNINAEKGWGHITCEGTQKIFGKDMFAMQSAFESLPDAQIGMLVAFSVGCGPKGPHATNLRPYSPSGDHVYTGTVRSFNETKGWGFIEAEEAKANFHNDIFMHKKDCPDGTTPTVGGEVQFVVEISHGRAIARHIQVGNAGAAVACDFAGGEQVWPAAGMAGARAAPY